MMDTRLSLALEAGHVALPEVGDIAVFGASGQVLTGLPAERLVLICDDVIAAESYKAQGYHVQVEPPESAALGLVFVPRGRIEGRVMFARAAALAAGKLIVDGAKTDGIDSHFKELRARGDCTAAYSKAHGKVFACDVTAEALADWAEQGEGGENEAGFFTVPGVFSSVKADEGSLLLAEALPDNLGKHVADLGAGWGYLSRAVLTRESVEELHLVEASSAALSCAKRNLPDVRAQFHWADATRWEPKFNFDTVVMNPPFHVGRKGVPELGQQFIDSAANILKGMGKLYMVANRHLPYEDILRERFKFVEEIGGNTRFKLLHAAKPSRKR
ncbi:class I SAM-dependent methyltransferase [Lentibacter algarum]|uniref:class I SAM-dependent methyltransferase n=1 Tax=Lentibacter algarum TaxID=576131 RepID=UPI0020913E9B|nr:methyltransferase [Lentibacter algarum]